MKHLIILLLIFSIPTQKITAQKLGLMHLIAYAHITQPEFNDEVIKKGYTYEGPIKNDIVEGQIYFFNGYIEGKKAQKYCIKYKKFNKSYQSTVGYQTMDAEEYKEIFSDIKVLEFEFVKSDKVEKTTFYYYRKKMEGYGYVLQIALDAQIPGVFQFDLMYIPN
jgi:hypothetical protein